MEKEKKNSTRIRNSDDRTRCWLSLCQCHLVVDSVVLPGDFVNTDTHTRTTTERNEGKIVERREEGEIVHCNRRCEWLGEKNVQ